MCGSRQVGDGAQETLIKIAKETKLKESGKEADDQKAREWFEGLRNERSVKNVLMTDSLLTCYRFATDVFA